MPVCSTFKVRGYHLDGYGHVNHARYLEFMEDARWAFFDGRLDLAEWRRRGLIWVVVNVNINYRSEGRLGDELEVTVDLARLGRRSGVLKQLIRRRGSAELVTDAEVSFVILDERSGRAVELDGEIREMLERMAADPDGAPSS